MAFEFKGAENLNEVFEDYPLDHFGFAQISQGKLGFPGLTSPGGSFHVKADDILFLFA